MNRKKIGFIYFDDIHHIHHFLSVFISLYNTKAYDVRIFTYEGEHLYLKKLLKIAGIPFSVLQILETYNYRKILNKIRNRNRINHIFIFKKNKRVLLNQDVLVYNVPQQKYLIDLRKNGKPKFVYLDHGAGDRNYVYNERLISFDLITIAGKKVERQCKVNANFSNSQLKICGYQKFDSILLEKKEIRFFENNKPIVIYNPHFIKDFSSYYSVGEKVLDFFYNSKDYNLIFAPHINLFNKRKCLEKESFSKEYSTANNILIDFGSENSVNMRYTLAADIYLGDVSSQVYEFLTKPRPCVFLNPNNVNWKDNEYFRNWNLGKVITNISNLKNILDTSSRWQTEFLEKQVIITKETYEVSEEINATERIVTEIIKFI